jgi:hypothetical protein
VSLYPTPSRLKLLRAIADGQVWRDNWFPYGDFEVGAGRRVNSRIAEMQRAGWVYLGSEPGMGATHWHLTEAGQQILQANTTSTEVTP